MYGQMRHDFSDGGLVRYESYDGLCVIQGGTILSHM